LIFGHRPLLAGYWLGAIVSALFANCKTDQKAGDKSGDLARNFGNFGSSGMSVRVG
jgi:hypothetical protein